MAALAVFDQFCKKEDLASRGGEELKDAQKSIAAACSSLFVHLQNIANQHKLPLKEVTWSCFSHLQEILKSSEKQSTFEPNTLVNQVLKQFEMEFMNEEEPSSKFLRRNSTSSLSTSDDTPEKEETIRKGDVTSGNSTDSFRLESIED